MNLAVLELETALTAYAAQILDIRLLVAAVVGVSLLLVARWALSK